MSRRCFSKCDSTISYVKCTSGRRAYLELPVLEFTAVFAVLSLGGDPLFALAGASFATLSSALALALADSCEG